MAWLAFWLLVAHAEPSASESGALSEAPMFAPPPTAEVEDHTLALGSQLRCPVCQGLSISDSPSDAARDMLARVRELVSLGYSDEQIVKYFTDRYGTWILLAPPPKDFMPLWLMPVAVVLGGAATIAWAFRSGQKSAAPTTPSAGAPGAPAVADNEPYKARVMALLQGENEEGV